MRSPRTARGESLAETPGSRPAVTPRQLSFGIAAGVWALVVVLGYRGDIPFTAFVAATVASGTVAAGLDLGAYVVLLLLFAPFQYAFAYMPYLDEISIRFLVPTTAQAIAKDIVYLPVVLVAIGAVVVRRRLPLVMAPLWWLPAALGMYLGVMALWRTNMEWLITIAGLRSLVEFLPLALVVPIAVRSLPGIRRLAAAFLAGVGAVTVLTLVEFVLPRVAAWRIIDARLAATLLNPNNLAAFLGIGAVATAALMVTRPRQERPVWGWLLLGGAAIGLLISQSRAGGFAAAVGVMAVLLLGGRRRAALRAAALLAAIVLGLAIFAPGLAGRYLFLAQPPPNAVETVQETGVVSLYGSGKADLSLLERLGELRRGLEYVALNPLFGQGLGFAGNVRGATTATGLPLVALMPHNVYLLLALNGGLIALGLFVAILVLLAREGLRLRGAPEPDLRALGLGLFGMTVTYGLYGLGAEFIEHFPHSVIFWIAVGVAVSARRLFPEVATGRAAEDPAGDLEGPAGGSVGGQS